MTVTTGTVPEVTLGWRLQIALGYADVSVQEMADELGVSRSTVSRWLNEHGAPPRTAFVKQWALRTGVAYEWLRNGWAPRGSNPEPTVSGASHVIGLFTRRRVAFTPEPVGYVSAQVADLQAA